MCDGERWALFGEENGSVLISLRIVRQEKYNKLYVV